MKKSYIYAIKNLINNKVYIGSTKSPKSRKYGHFYSLRKGLHHSQHLQKSYDLNGKDKFAFYIIEECNQSDRKIKEIYYINLYKSSDREFGYNISEPSEDNFKCSLETKEKLKITNTRIGKSKPIDVYDINTLNLVRKFDSINECATIMNIKSGTVSDIIAGKRKSHKGFTFVLSGQLCTYTKSSKYRDMIKYRK